MSGDLDDDDELPDATKDSSSNDTLPHSDTPALAEQTEAQATLTPEEEYSLSDIMDVSCEPEKLEVEVYVPMFDDDDADSDCLYQPLGDMAAPEDNKNSDDEDDFPFFKLSDITSDCKIVSTSPMMMTRSTAKRTSSDSDKPNSDCKIVSTSPMMMTRSTAKRTSSDSDKPKIVIPPKRPSIAYYRPSRAPPLTRQMLEEAEEIMIGNPADIIQNRPRHSVKRADLVCLKPGVWLIDTVVDFYLAMIAERNRNRSEQCSKIFMFRSTFYALLESQQGIRKVEQAADDVNIFEYEYIFFPACVSRHWRLIVVNVDKKTVTAYNSIAERGDKVIMTNVIRYLKSEFKRRYPPRPRHPPGAQENRDAGDAAAPSPAASSWSTFTATSVSERVPQQDNCDDCGVFICQFADYLSRRADMDFAAKHMNYFRARMTFEIKRGRVLT